jgi:mRNA-degrading endonuclease RelE of RelBE toxin-antitoxin system
VEYSLVILKSAETDMDALDAPTRIRIVERLEWLGKNADQVAHHRLQGMPEKLAGLCRFRVGDYRVLYWKRDSPPTLFAFRVRHRSVVYKNL